MWFKVMEGELLEKLPWSQDDGICPPYLEKGPAFTFLWAELKGFQSEILRLGDKMTPKCLNSDCP